MVMTLAANAAANEAARDRGDGESIISLGFKFAILAIALFAFVALLVGLWLFNNWAGIVDFGGSLLTWISDRIGGFWGGLTGLVPAVGSWLFSPVERITSSSAYDRGIRGINPSDIV